MNDIKVIVKPFQNRTKSALDVGCRSLTLTWMLNVGRSRFFVVLLLLLLTAIAACGKKAMPSPPGAQPVPAVSDLSYEIDGADVLLEWTVPMDVAEGETIVSRATTKLSDEMCDECPLAFQQVTVMPINSQRGAMKQTYRDSLSPGFRYTYRIMLKINGGRTSSASNLVTFDY